MENYSPYQKFKTSILDILKEKPQNTSTILSKIKSKYPDECDDTILCIHGSIDSRQPEWDHLVRTAQQNLKKSKLISHDSFTKLWKIF